MALPADFNGIIKTTLAAIYNAINGSDPDNFQATINSADASSATQVKAGVASKSIYITDLIISTDTALNFKLQDNTGTPVVLGNKLYFPAVSIFSKSFKTPIKVATGKDLNILASGAGNVTVIATGYVK